jgi:two-component system sensor histidine kinase VanS
VDIKLKNKFFEQERDLQVLYRKLFFQMVIVAILYTVIGIAAYIGIRQILEHIEIFYSLVNWIEVNRVIGFFTYIIVGYIIILIYFWKKPFSYLNDVLIATSSMYGQENKMITLPSQLKTIENYLNELRSDIQESKTAALNAEQRKNDMISFLAHDLKTPLTSIIGYLSLLNDTPDMSKEEKAKCVHVSIEKAQRLEEMINEFFDITRYNLHQVELEKEIIDLYYMFVQLSDEFYPLLSEHGNTIQLLADEDLTVYADPVKLARVFNNILKNAIYYSYPDTEIIVSGKKVQANIVITFQNQGKTIPQQKLVALFDKFFRLDDARTSNTGGTGLGLAIAKDIVNLHGGNITAESQDEITIFTITLPS